LAKLIPTVQAKVDKVNKKLQASQVVHDNAEIATEIRVHECQMRRGKFGGDVQHP